MRRNLMLARFGATILGVAFYYSTKARATAGSGFTAVTVAKGTLGQFEVFNHFVPQPKRRRQEGLAVLQKTRRRVDWIGAKHPPLRCEISSVHNPQSQPQNGQQRPKDLSAVTVHS